MSGIIPTTKNTLLPKIKHKFDVDKVPDFV